MMTSGSVVIPRCVACWMFADTYTAEAPIGRFQMLSREKGQSRGSRPPGGPPPGGGGFAVTETEIEVGGMGVPFEPVTGTVFEPAAFPARFQFNVCLHLTLEGGQKPVPPRGREATVSPTP